MDQRNKICLITGVSSGIGAALAHEMAARGWVVIGVARSIDKLACLEKDLGKEHFIPLACDVSDANAIQKASARLKQEGIIPSLYFLNAGIAGEEAVENPDHFQTSHHQKIMAVNYFGVLAWIEEWANYLKERNGGIFVATSSINAYFAPPCGSAYAASKAAIAKAFESLRLTYYGSKLRFVTVYPGPVATKGLKGKVPFIWSPEKMAKVMAHKVLAGKEHIEPSLFYALVTKFLRLLPAKLTLKILATLK